MSLFSSKNDIFDFTMSWARATRAAIDGKINLKLEKNRFVSLIKDDPKSPVLMGMGCNKHLIYYPSFSTPYLHSQEKSVKKIEILDGEIFDLISGKKYVTGDKFDLIPGENIQPYTKNKECYVRVTITQIDDIWNHKCQ